MSKSQRSQLADAIYAESELRLCAARAAICAGPAPCARKSHSAAAGSVGSTGCTISSVKVFLVAESGAVVRKRANSAIIVSVEKSRVQTRRKEWLAISETTL